MTKQVLAVDIGGTKTVVASCTVEGGKVLHVDGLATYPSQKYSSLEDILSEWRQSHGASSVAAIGAGIAGPIQGVVGAQTAKLTNLPWSVDSRVLGAMFGSVPVYLCNDMEAHGWGILGLNAEDCEILNDGQSADGSKTLIAAGTGLGESLIPWDGKRCIPLGGEGGHAAFASSSEREDDLLKFLRSKYHSHVSWERVLGGQDGFRNLCSFWAIKHPDAARPLMAAVDGTRDWGAGVIGLASKGDRFSDEVVSWYASLYGREASNLAVKIVPRGGVYIGGGIATRIMPWLRREFMGGFTDKGRFSDLMSTIPVRVIRDGLNGLKGAALAANGMIVSLGSYPN